MGPRVSQYANVNLDEGLLIGAQCNFHLVSHQWLIIKLCVLEKNLQNFPQFFFEINSLQRVDFIFITNFLEKKIYVKIMKIGIQYNLDQMSF
jgi:hypothetical protein